MKRMLRIVALVLSVAMSSYAQTDDAKDAFAVVEKMFAEMANHNPAAIAELYTKDSNLTAIIKNKDGKSRVMSFTGEAFSKNFAEKRGEIKEIMYAPKTEVDGDLAIIYGRYVFFVNDKISHCGVNAFHLVRTETGWKIANASSTIDPTSCTEKEKGMSSK